MPTCSTKQDFLSGWASGESQTEHRNSPATGRVRVGRLWLSAINLDANGGTAADINDSLMKSVDHTAGLSQLNDTNEAAEAIVAGLARARSRLGG